MFWPSLNVNLWHLISPGHLYQRNRSPGSSITYQVHFTQILNTKWSPLLCRCGGKSLVCTYMCLRYTKYNNIHNDEIKYCPLVPLVFHSSERSHFVWLFVIMRVCIKFPELSESANAWLVLGSVRQRYTNKRPNSAARWDAAYYLFWGMLCAEVTFPLSFHHLLTFFCNAGSESRSRLRSLLNLRLSGLDISDSTLKLIVRHLPLLRRLDLSHCQELTDQSINLITASGCNTRNTLRQLNLAGTLDLLPCT